MLRFREARSKVLGEWQRPCRRRQEPVRGASSRHHQGVRFPNYDDEVGRGDAAVVGGVDVVAYNCVLHSAAPGPIWFVCLCWSVLQFPGRARIGSALLPSGILSAMLEI